MGDLFSAYESVDNADNADELEVINPIKKWVHERSQLKVGDWILCDDHSLKHKREPIQSISHIDAGTDNPIFVMSNGLIIEISWRRNAYRIEYCRGLVTTCNA